MEIEITQLASEDMFEFSHSAAEGGQDAGRNTWNAALAGPRPLLDSPEKLEAMRDWMKDSGGWDAEERAAMADNELEAMFLQLVAGDCREAGADSLEEIKWGSVEDRIAEGRISCNIFKSGDQYFYYLGN